MAQDFDFDFERQDAENRAAANEAAKATCQLYLVFATDERARALLAKWKAESKAVLPIDASVQAYAAKEFARRFIDIIEDNIELAKSVTR